MLCKALIFGIIVGSISSGAAIGPSMILAFNRTGRETFVTLELIFSVLVLSILINIWLLVARTVWRDHLRGEATSCVAASYFFVFFFDAVFAILIGT